MPSVKWRPFCLGPTVLIHIRIQTLPEKTSTAVGVWLINTNKFVVKCIFTDDAPVFLHNKHTTLSSGLLFQNGDEMQDRRPSHLRYFDQIPS